MKYFIKCFVLIFLIIACKEKTHQAKGEFAEINIDSLEKLGFEKYAVDPIASIEIFKEVAERYYNVQNFEKSGQTHLNLAGIFEERLEDHSTALMHGKKSLEDWTKAKNKMQMANLFKYLGYLEALNDNQEEAEKNIHTAIKMYEEMDFPQGMAVSNINMAKVKVIASDYEEAVPYFISSKKFWQDRQNKSRIFDNNLTGIEIFNGLKNQEEKDILIQENEEILTQANINEYLLKRFRNITSQR